jgi:translation initiation factor IF-2
MQHKIRINDLARELEVKSKEILDVLLKVGVTEKKTHSSSIEVDQAERVKKYYQEHEPSAGRSARVAPAPDEFKPKIDLSHISKPGDVLKAITQRAAQPAAPPRQVAPPSHAVPTRSAVTPPSAVPPKPAPPLTATASTQPATAVEPKPAPRFITPQSVARPPAAVIVRPKPPAPPAAPATHASTVSEAAKPIEATIQDQVAVLDEPETAVAPETLAPEIVAEIESAHAGPVSQARPAAPATPSVQPGVRPAQPAAAARRLIVPQTGPRPVYLAPARAATPPRAVMPERGKPIFQRPRPGMPPAGGSRHSSAGAAG